MKLADFDFRIWDKGEETLTYASKDWKLDIGFSNPQQDYGVCESELHAYYDGEPMCPSDCEIELWSGLCDKNGKRIYEGDILAHDNGYGIEYHSKVVFENGVFKIAIIEHPAVEIIEDLRTGFVAVVGNIHENADLLGKERGLIMRIECKYEDIYDSKGFPKY